MIKNFGNHKVISISEPKDILPYLIPIIFFLTTFYVAVFISYENWNNDVLFYYFSGKEIIIGNGINVYVPNGPIGWPIILSLTDSIINNAYITAEIISILSTTGMVFLTYFIAKNFFGYRISLLTQILVAVNPFLHSEAINLHNESLAVFLLFISLYFLTKKELSYRYTIIGSIFLGISCITRYPAFLFTIGFTVLFLINPSKKNLKLLSIFLITFIITITPLLLYYIFTHGVLVDLDPNFYMQKEAIYSSIESPSKESVSSFFGNFKLFVKNYLYNLFVMNSHMIFNLGLGWNTLTILPLIPFVSIIFVLGGIIVLLKKQLKPKIIFGLIVTVICFGLLWYTDKIQTHYFSLIIIPLTVLVLLNIKKIQHQHIQILLIPGIFLLGISIIPINSPQDMLYIILFPFLFAAYFISTSIKDIFFRFSKNLQKNSISKITLFAVILFLIMSNLLFSTMLEKFMLYREDMDYKKLFSSENLPLHREKYNQICEVLVKEANIQEKIIMASTLDYAYCTGSKFLYVDGRHMLSESLQSVIFREDLSPYLHLRYDISSYPPNKNGLNFQIPDYLILDYSYGDYSEFIEKSNDSEFSMSLLYSINDPSIEIWKIERTD